MITVFFACNNFMNSIDKSKFIDIIYSVITNSVQGGVLMELDEKRTPIVFKALCDENRVRILKYLMGGEKCACKLLDDLNIAQSTLSHHMKILTDSGLVVGRKEGKWMHYSISSDGIDIAIGYLNVLKENGCTCNNKSCCEK